MRLGIKHLDGELSMLCLVLDEIDLPHAALAEPL